ncbi:TIR domain-containing protein [Streptomyces iakyrus]|uniref:TIR domain-containing protein n=1 Tax=Streptomyces iakyrus TaxID=68219 RepID=UPI003D90484A
MRDEARHDVFISYSQQKDHQIAAEFQRAIENFGRPWYRPRELRVFRDTTNLSASPDLWKDIEKELSRSDWLIVLASPEAAASTWVCDEITWWIAHGRTDRMLIALTRGSLVWDASVRTFDWSKSDALPESVMADALAAAPRVPRWVDLTKLSERIEKADRISRDDPELLVITAEVVAPIRGDTKDALIGDHLNQRRRRNQAVGSAISVLSALLVLAVVLGLIAERQRDTATERQLTATSRQLVAEAASIRDTQPDLAKQLLVQAYRMSPTAQVIGALIDSAAIPRVIRTDGRSQAVAFSPNHRVLASASGAGVRLYDAISAQPLAELTGQRRSATAVAFRQDGQLLAVGDADGQVQLWKVASAAEPELLGTVTPTSGYVHSFAFAGKEPRLVVASDGAQTSVVDIRNPRQPHVLESLAPFDLAGLSEGLAVSPDGRLVAAAGEGGRFASCG